MFDKDREDFLFELFIGKEIARSWHYWNCNL